MSSLRCFIALEIPSPVQHQIARRIHQLQINIPQGIRWETPSKIHLTLRFLGDIPAEKIQEIKGCLNINAARFAPFILNISELGVFPHWKAPRVVWLGLDQPNELMMLQRSLDISINALGFEPERKPFSPHLTIGRIQNHLPTDEIGEIGKLLREQAVAPVGAVACETICLFQSLLKPTGSIYTPLSAVKLAKRD